MYVHVCIYVCIETETYMYTRVCICMYILYIGAHLSVVGDLQLRFFMENEFGLYREMPSDSRYDHEDKEAEE